MAEQEKELREALSQSTYRGTAYEDSSWEVVGEFANSTTFEPIAFEVLDGRAMTADPMFADYGGVPDKGETRRLHGGGGGRYDPSRRTGKSEQEVTEAAEDVLKRLEESHRVQLEEVRAQAFEEGRKAGEAMIDEKIQGVEASFGTVLEDVGQQLNENIRMMEQQAVTLAIEIARKLVGAAVEINPEYILEIVKEAIRLAGGAVIRSIRVSPQDHEFISLLNLPKQFKDFDGTWSFERDDGVKSGCIVMTSGGEVDFQLDPAWERIRDKVVKLSAG